MLEDGRMYYIRQSIVSLGASLCYKLNQTNDNINRELRPHMLPSSMTVVIGPHRTNRLKLLSRSLTRTTSSIDLLLD
jgi:hypothetical protein